MIVWTISGIILFVVIMILLYILTDYLKKKAIEEKNKYIRKSALYKTPSLIDSIIYVGVERRYERAKSGIIVTIIVFFIFPLYVLNVNKIIFIIIVVSSVICVLMYEFAEDKKNSIILLVIIIVSCIIISLIYFINIYNRSEHNSPFLQYRVFETSREDFYISDIEGFINTVKRNNNDEKRLVSVQYNGNTYQSEEELDELLSELDVNQKYTFNYETKDNYIETIYIYRYFTEDEKIIMNIINDKNSN